MGRLLLAFLMLAAFVCAEAATQESPESKREAMMKAYLNQQREIKHQEAVIEKLKSFNREKSIKRAADKEIGDRLLKEFSKKEWKDKGLIVRRAYR